MRTAEVRPEHDALLPPEDLQRRSRYVQEADRRRATAAGAVLRSSSATTWACRPRSW